MIITVSDRPAPTDELPFARERKTDPNATLATRIHAIMNASVIPRWLMSLSGGSFEELRPLGFDANIRVTILSIVTATYTSSEEETLAVAASLTLI